MPKRTHRKHSSRSSEEGFVSNDLKSTMNKNEKIIMGILIGGIILFLILSMFVLLRKNRTNITTQKPPSTVVPTQRVNLTPYPTIPPVKNDTVLLHSRLFNPQSVSIPRGGMIDFINIDTEPITIEAKDTASKIVDLGILQPNEDKIVTFKNAGTYTFRNHNITSEIGIIIVK